MVASSLVPSHSFQVEVLDITESGSPENFYRVEGLKVSLNTSEYMPGGYNKPLDIPISSNVGDLKLRRPLVVDKTKISKWCAEGLNQLSFKPTSVHILILSREQKVIAQWVAMGAYPKGLEINSIGMGTQSFIEEVITIGCTNLVRKL